MNTKEDFLNTVNVNELEEEDHLLKKDDHFIKEDFQNTVNVNELEKEDHLLKEDCHQGQLREHRW